MTAPKLTKAQRAALEVLAENKKPVRTSNHTGRRIGHYLPFVHGGVAVTLEKRRLARCVCVMPDDREVRGADLGRLLGLYERAYLITDAGRAALKDYGPCAYCGRMHKILPDFVGYESNALCPKCAALKDGAK